MHLGAGSYSGAARELASADNLLELIVCLSQGAFARNLATRSLLAQAGGASKYRVWQFLSQMHVAASAVPFLSDPFLNYWPGVQVSIRTLVAVVPTREYDSIARSRVICNIDTI